MVKSRKYFKIYGWYSPLVTPNLTLASWLSPVKWRLYKQRQLCGDFNVHSKRWNYNQLNAAGTVMENLLNSDKLYLIYNDSDIPTQLHYNGNGTVLIQIWHWPSASADIADDTAREVIYDSRSGHHMIVSEFNIN